MDVPPTIQHLHGRIFVYTGADPAAGAEAIITVPAKRRWKIHTIRFSLVTNDSEIDRTIAILFDDGTNIFLSIASPTVQPESSTKHYYFANTGVPEINVLLISTNPIPTISLPAGYRIRTGTTNLQAADDYSAPILLVEEWIDP